MSKVLFKLSKSLQFGGRVNNNILQVIRESNWSQDLPTEVVEQIALNSSIVDFNCGDVIHWQEEGEVNALYCIINGAIKISSNSWEGKETVLTYLAPGNWFGEIAMFDGFHRTHTARAHVDSQLLQISKKEVMNIITTFPMFYEYIIKLLCEKIRMLMMVVEDTSLLPLPVRLARRLLMLADSFGVETDGGIEIKIRLPQEELGQMLGTSRQSTNKLLRKFETLGLIETKYRNVLLKDIKGLNNMLSR